MSDGDINVVVLQRDCFEYNSGIDVLFTTKKMVFKSNQSCKINIEIIKQNKNIVLFNIGRIKRFIDNYIPISTSAIQ
jgi:hypothetical protein